MFCDAQSHGLSLTQLYKLHSLLEILNLANNRADTVMASLQQEVQHLPLTEL